MRGEGSEGTGETCPRLTCLHTGDAGGVKHSLPLSRTQRDLVCQQVYLTQRPTRREDKTETTGCECGTGPAHAFRRVCRKCICTVVQTSGTFFCTRERHAGLVQERKGHDYKPPPFVLPVMDDLLPSKVQARHKAHIKGRQLVYRDVK